MRFLRRNPLRAVVFGCCLALLTVGVSTVGERRADTTRASIIAGAPLAVEESLFPPHREPPPPPPPPPPSPSPPPPPKPLSPKAALRLAILDGLTGSTARTRGIAVDVDGLGRVVDVNAGALLIPASLTKLFTGGSAMLRLPADLRFRTTVESFGPVLPDRTLEGSLLLVAGGDPSLTKDDLSGLAVAVKAGIDKVSGDLYVDDTSYDRARSAPGWKPTYFSKQVGSLSAFAVDHNTWRTDPAYYDDPATGNLELFRSLLVEKGVVVTGAANRLGRPDATPAATIASHDSASLSSLLSETLHKSDNFYAELILKELGRSAGNPTTSGGVEVVQAVARDLGVARGPVFDGSGLSLDDRESASHVVEWLEAIEKTSVGQGLENSLAVSCGGGPTLLERRLCGTPAAGRVHGKTGALAQSRSLAGYTSTASGRRVWFAFVLNDVATADEAWRAMDQALVAINSFAG